MELLYEAADAWMQADNGQKSAVIANQAEKIGVAASTLYRRLKKEGLIQTCRRTRCDKDTIKKEGVTTDHFMLVIAYANTSRRNTGTIEMPIEKAIMDLEANGKIPAGLLTADMVNRHLRRMEASKRDLLAATPHQEMASLHPNHVHEMDPSVCLQWYFDDKNGGTTERDMVAVVYKNKPDELAKAAGKKTKKILRYVLEDHFTGTLFVKYYYTYGESSANAVDFLINAWMPKTDGNPFHGAPNILLWDQGSANKGHSARNFCDALGVEIITHVPHNPRAKGGVEKGNHIVQTWFESGLRISPATDIDQLNTLAARWCIWFNATRIHTRHGFTRNALWMTISAEQLRIISADEKQLRSLASGKIIKRLVGGDYRIRMGKRDDQPLTFNLANIPGVCPGIKVDVRLNPFNPDQCNIRVNVDDNWLLVDRDQYMPAIEGGFHLGAAVFGQTHKSKPATQAMRNASRLERIAYDVDTDKEAKSAHNRKQTPFADMDAHKVINDFVSPTYLPRSGTELPIAASAEPAPMSLFKAMQIIAKRRGSRLSGGENAALKAAYPTGMTDAQITAWINEPGGKTPALRAVQ